MMNVDLNGRRVLLFGHADADGHLAAEQSRRNVLSAGAKHCDVVVDPKITRTYRFWEKHLHSVQINDADVVIFVDLAFNPNDPRLSFEALADFAAQEPDRLFMVIDHQPVRRLPRSPSNVFLSFAPTVFLTCYGMPSELMIIAAICDSDAGSVVHLTTPLHEKRALAVQRAAADIVGLAGAPLLALLSTDQWDILESLADDPAEAHRRVRGRRVASVPPSEALTTARRVAAG